MTLRSTFISALTAALLAAPALAMPSDQGPHRSLVIGGDCVDCTFEDANLAGAQFLGGDFRNANFRDAELLGARLVNLNLSNADFSDASLVEAHFAHSGLESATLRDAQLDRSRFHEVRLIGANLSETNLVEAVMLMVDLTGADLSEANARNAVFRQSVFTGAVVRGSGFNDAHFNGVRFHGLNARNANFQGAIFENVDFTGADLRNVNVTGARFAMVNLTGADLRGVEGLTEQHLNRACGVEVRGIPDNLTLSPCSTAAVIETEQRVAMAVAASQESLAALRAQRREQIAQAREAFEHAIANVEVRVGSSDRMRLEAIAAAREGWESAAEALAEAEIELAEEFGDMNWSFEIRRAEIGEPIRVILEQASPEDVVVLAPREPLRAPPPPPSPPAPKLPERAEDGSENSWVSNEGETLIFDASRVEIRELAISAADIAFMIDATVSNYGERPDAQGLSFRNVQAGGQITRETTNPVLCGEVEASGDEANQSWTRFATLNDGGFDVIEGAEAEALCSSNTVVIQPSADLGIRIERGIARLAE